MRPILIPLLERLGRRTLRSRGAGVRWVDTPLGPVHTYDLPGRGPLSPVVLLHGLGASATPFGPMMGRLQPHVRRLVAPDYPGHGFSGEADGIVTPTALFEAMTTVLDAFVTEPAVLVGNSLGGAVAMHYAMSHPHRVRALVLLSPAGARFTREEWREFLASIHLRSRAEALAFLSNVYHRVPRAARLGAHEIPAATMMRRAVREILAAASIDGIFPADAFKRLTMPILLVWGKSERFLPASHLTWFRENLPAHAIIEEPEGIGHVPPARIAERILRFARELESQSGVPSRERISLQASTNAR
jgi:pimeloyl-ACP methyl ester carboxylesterase